MKKVPSDKDKYRFKQAMKALDGGKPSDALRLFGKVRKSWGDDPDIGYLEGLAYGKLGDTKRIISVSQRALKMAPGHFGALCNLANAQMAVGDKVGALENYAKALEANPDAAEVLNNYGRALSLIGRREEAIEQYKKALKNNPNHAPAYSALGKAYAEAGHPKKALDEFEKALKLDPESYEAHVGMGVLNCGSGGLDKAEFHFQEALHLEKNNVSALIGLANVRRYTADYDGALEYINRAEKCSRENNPSHLAFKAHLFEQKGDKEQAYNIINQLVGTDDMSPQAVTVLSKLCRKYDRCDEAITLIDSYVSRPETDNGEKQALMFAAGDLLDKLGRYDDAMQYYKQANNSIDIRCDRSKHIRLHDEIINAFSKDDLKDMPRASTGSSRPIFVVGMPRSGTTLTEQILSSHPDVFGAGELHYIKQLDLSIRNKNQTLISDYASKIKCLNQNSITELANNYLDKLDKIDNQARYVIDKMPHNFLQVGLISLIFPEARIVHCKRNPLDNALSIYFQAFIWSHDYASDLADIGFYYKEYERIMRHWEGVIDMPIMTVQYESMIEDQEGVTRKLLEFCHLEWNESVRNFYRSERNVSTASYDQVRQPIYKTSKERWRNYEKHIGTLIDVLGQSV